MEPFPHSAHGSHSHQERISRVDLNGQHLCIELPRYSTFYIVPKLFLIQVRRECKKDACILLSVQGKKEDDVNITITFNNMSSVKFKAQPKKFFYRYRQSNVRWLHPASDNCRALFRCVHCAQRLVIGRREEPPNN